MNLFLGYILSILFFCLVPTFAIADYKLYSIDDVYYAPFPSLPVFNGEAGEGVGKHRSYGFVDEPYISYNATYSVHPVNFTKNIIKKSLKTYVDNLAIGGNSKLVSYSAEKINNVDSARYVTEKVTNGIVVKKHGIVIYKNDRFHGWSVTGVANNKQSAEQIFNFYYKYIKIK